MGDHSTSDDSTSYRPKDEVAEWANNHYPTTKFRLYLENRGLWNEEEEKTLLKSAQTEVLSALSASEKKKKHKWTEMYEDVYKFLPPHIRLILWFKFKLYFYTINVLGSNKKL